MSSTVLKSRLFLFPSSSNLVAGDETETTLWVAFFSPSSSLSPSSYTSFHQIKFNLQIQRLQLHYPPAYRPLHFPHQNGLFERETIPGAIRNSLPGASSRHPLASQPNHDQVQHSSHISQLYRCPASLALLLSFALHPITFQKCYVQSVNDTSFEKPYSTTIT